jgi:hypothetical protein
VVTLPNYMKLILNFRLLINFDRPIPLCAPVQFTEEDLTDIRKVIQICTANLTVIRDHLNVCKDGVMKKQNYLLAADLI